MNCFAGVDRKSEKETINREATAFMARQTRHHCCEHWPCCILALKFASAVEGQAGLHRLAQASSLGSWACMRGISILPLYPVVFIYLQLNEAPLSACAGPTDWQAWNSRQPSPGATPGQLDGFDAAAASAMATPSAEPSPRPEPKPALPEGVPSALKPAPGCPVLLYLQRARKRT